MYLEVDLYPGEGLTQLWVCTLQWDEFASRGVFALRLGGMEGMSGTRRPPGRAALRSCWAAVPAAGCPAGAVSRAGQGVAVPVSQCYPGSLGKRAPHQRAPTRLTRGWVQGAHGAEMPECCDIGRPASLTGNPSPKSLEAGRVSGRVQTCPARPLPGTGAAVGGAGLRPGVPGAVPVQDELQAAAVCPCVMPGCWGTREGGRGLCPAFFQSRWLPAVGALVSYTFSTAVEDPSPQ